LTETKLISCATNQAGGRRTVQSKITTGISALAFLIVSSVFATVATAETTTKPAAPAATAPVKPAPAATTAATTKPVEKKVATPSPCKGLDEKACGGNKICAWIVPKDPNNKTGKLQEPYCRKVAGVALKKPAVAKPVTTPAAATTTPAAKPVTAAKPATPPAPPAAQ
jgi:hypothetical protein